MALVDSVRKLDVAADELERGRMNIIRPGVQFERVAQQIEEASGDLGSPDLDEALAYVRQCKEAADLLAQMALLASQSLRGHVTRLQANVR
jgi:hypothetical protein